MAASRLRSRARGAGPGLEQRPDRRADQPAENHQAPDVWPGQPRSTRTQVPACRMITKSCQEPSKWQDRHPEFGRVIPYVILCLSTTARFVHHANPRTTLTEGHGDEPAHDEADHPAAAPVLRISAHPVANATPHGRVPEDPATSAPCRASSHTGSAADCRPLARWSAAPGPAR